MDNRVDNDKIKAYLESLNPYDLKYLLLNSGNLGMYTIPIKTIGTVIITKYIGSEDDMIEIRRAVYDYDDFYRNMETFTKNGLMSIPFYKAIFQLAGSDFSKKISVYDNLSKLYYRMISDDVQKSLDKINHGKIDFIINDIIRYKIRVLKLILGLESFIDDRLYNLSDLSEKIFNVVQYIYSDSKLNEQTYNHVKINSLYKFITYSGVYDGTEDKDTLTRILIPVVGLNLIGNHNFMVEDSAKTLASMYADSIKRSDFLEYTYERSVVEASDIPEGMSYLSNPDTVATYGVDCALIGDATGAENMSTSELVALLHEVNELNIQEYIGDNNIDFSIPENDIGYIRKELKNPVAIVDYMITNFRTIMKYNDILYVLFKIPAHSNLVFGISLYQDVNSLKRKIFMQKIPDDVSYKFATK